MPGSEIVGKEINNANAERTWKKITRELGREQGGGARKHFFKKLVPVYQLLVYPLIGRF